MLILMRRLEESVIIGKEIEIKIIKIQGNQVHLGIKADREIVVLRKEMLTKDQLRELFGDDHDEAESDVDGNVE